MFHHFDLEKQEGCGSVARERVTEPCITIEWLLTKPRTFWNLRAFLDFYGRIHQNRCTKMYKNRPTVLTISKSNLHYFNLYIIVNIYNYTIFEIFNDHFDVIAKNILDFFMIFTQNAIFLYLRRDWECFWVFYPQDFMWFCGIWSQLLYKSQFETGI